MAKDWRVKVQGKEEEKKKKTPEEIAREQEEAQRKIEIREKAKHKSLMSGASEKEASEVGRRSVREGVLEPQAREEFIESEKPRLEKQFDDASVFKEIEQEPIIPPEQENLGVISDIMRGVVRNLGAAKDLERKPFFSNLFKSLAPGTRTEPMSQIEAEIQAKEMASQIKEVNVKIIDDQIGNTENILREAGIQIEELPPMTREGKSEKAMSATGVITGVAGVGVGQAITKPLNQFVGTDGQISNLEMALSQYNEMITLPATGFDSGMTSTQCFDQLDRMEEGILALESQLRLSAIESASVRISLRGRAVDARILKLKTKIQNERMEVAKKTAARAFEEVPMTDSLSFLIELNNKYYNGRK